MPQPCPTFSQFHRVRSTTRSVHKGAAYNPESTKLGRMNSAMSASRIRLLLWPKPSMKFSVPLSYRTLSLDDYGQIDAHAIDYEVFAIFFASLLTYERHFTH